MLKQEIFRGPREQLGVRLVFLIDDQANLAQGRERAALQGQALVRVLLALGTHVGKSKSQLLPEQWARFLGLILDIAAMAFRVPEDKVAAFQQLVADTAGAESVTPRMVARLAGKMQAMALAVDLAPLMSQSIHKALSGAMGWDELYETPAALIADLQICLGLLETQNGRRWIHRQTLRCSRHAGQDHRIHRQIRGRLRG